MYHFFPGGKAELARVVVAETGAAVGDFFDGAAEVLVQSDYVDICPIGAVARDVGSTDEDLWLATAEVFDGWTRAATARLQADGIDTSATQACCVASADRPGPSWPPPPPPPPPPRVRRDLCVGSLTGETPDAQNLLGAYPGVMDTQLGPPAGATVDDLAGALTARGWVVLPERLPAPFVAELASAFEPLLARHIAAADPNRGVNRHQMYVPFEPPFSHPALWGHPAARAVLDAVLGPDHECTYYGSDTPFPGAEHQPAHQDGGPLFPGWDTTLPPYSIALNVPLVDVDEANGPLELFPGPHEPGADTEPLRCTLPAGSVLLRDTRVWHRGSPNVGPAPRPMLALLYTRPWYRFVLDRPAMSSETYDALPDPGRRLFRGADRPRAPRSGDRPRLSVPPPPV